MHPQSPHPHCTARYHTTPYHTTPHHTTPYHTIPHTTQRNQPQITIDRLLQHPESSSSSSAKRDKGRLKAGRPVEARVGWGGVGGYIGVCTHGHTFRRDRSEGISITSDNVAKLFARFVLFTFFKSKTHAPPTITQRGAMHRVRLDIPASCKHG